MNKSIKDITFLSAAYCPAESFKQMTNGLVVSNQRYTGYNINFYGIGEPQNFKSLYNAKVVNLLHILENKCDSEFICHIDSCDTFLNKELDDDFLNNFLSMGCSVVFNAETNCYPIEQLKFIDDVSSEYKYLNSGIFFGYRKYLIQLLKQCIEYYKKFPETQKIGWGAPNDQTFYWLVYLKDKLSFNNNIKLDHNYSLFLNVYGKDIEKDFNYSQGYMTQNEKRPYIVHAPGVYKIEAYKIMMKKLNFNV